MKTSYSVVLALCVGVAHLPFPLLPRHVTLIGSLTIGIPGFFLALAPNTERARPGVRPPCPVVGRARRARLRAGHVRVPTAWRCTHPEPTLAVDRTTAAMALFIAALAVVARPYTWWRLLLLIAVIAAFVLCAAVPVLADFFALTFTNPWDVAAADGVGALAALSLIALDRLLSSRSLGRRSS